MEITQEEREALRLQRKFYYEKYKNDPEAKRRRSEYYKKYAHEHKAERLAYIAAWKKKNPDKVRLYQARTAINWAKKHGLLKEMEGTNEQDSTDR